MLLMAPLAPMIIPAISVYKVNVSRLAVTRFSILHSKRINVEYVLEMDPNAKCKPEK